MSKPALNLLAITIFVMTVGSILSPVLKLSPFLPAGLAFGGLLLATVDRFVWDNQGVVLLVDGFAQASEAHRQRILHHEAGHFLVAYLLGIPVTGYALTAWEARQQGHQAQGGVRFDDQRIQAQIEEGQVSALLIDRYCQVWMAGSAAEKRKFGDIEGGVEDVIKVRSLLRHLQLPAPQLEQKERAAAYQAGHILARNDQAYQALMAAMAERQPVEDCISALVAAVPGSVEATGPAPSPSE